MQLGNYLFKGKYALHQRQVNREAGIWDEKETTTWECSLQKVEETYYIKNRVNSLVIDWDIYIVIRLVLVTKMQTQK